MHLSKIIIFSISLKMQLLPTVWNLYFYPANILSFLLYQEKVLNFIIIVYFKILKPNKNWRWKQATLLCLNVPDVRNMPFETCRGNILIMNKKSKKMLHKIKIKKVHETWFNDKEIFMVTSFVSSEQPSLF